MSLELVVPERLPVRAGGERLDHLSPSSIELFYSCPEAWRRRYLLRERWPRSGAMHLGSSVDEAVSGYFRSRLGGLELPAADVLETYREAWRWGLAQEEVRFEADQKPGALLDAGARLVGLYLDQVAPAVQGVIGVQRRIEFRLAPGLAWTVIGFMDVECEALIVDLKTKAKHLTSAQAGDSLQAGTYLLARRMEGRPAHAFQFHSLAHGLKEPGVRVVETRRTAGQLDTVLARIALAATHIVGLAERFGPQATWPLASPDNWRCSARFCGAYGRCVGGLALARAA